MGVRNQYKNGVENFYKNNGSYYQNKHIDIVLHILENDIGFYYNNTVLDLCCGNGEVTNLLKPYVKSIDGSDPFLYSKYIDNTGMKCKKLSFKDLAVGRLEDEYDIIICSFAMHLCEKSMLSNLLYNLKRKAKHLVIITPNKNPKIDLFWKLDKEIIVNRVRYRKYK